MLSKDDQELLANHDAYDMLDEILANPEILKDADMLEAFRARNKELAEFGS